MSDSDRGPRPGPNTTASSDAGGEKNSAQAEPEQVTPEQEGVSTDNLVYTERNDGLRDYASQKPVETTGDPTPQPEEKQVTPEEPAQQ